MRNAELKIGAREGSWNEDLVKSSGFVAVGLFEKGARLFLQVEQRSGRRRDVKASEFPVRQFYFRRCAWPGPGAVHFLVRRPIGKFLRRRVKNSTGFDCFLFGFFFSSIFKSRKGENMDALFLYLRRSEFFFFIYIFFMIGNSRYRATFKGPAANRKCGNGARRGRRNFFLSINFPIFLL